MRRVYLLMAVVMVGISAGAELSGYISSDIINLKEDENNKTIDFGFIPIISKNSSIGDFVWKDVNGDGIQDPDKMKEPGLKNVTVYLLDLESGTCTQTETDANGAYLFTGLKPGEYKVVVDMSTLPPDDEYEGPSPPYAVSDRSKDSDTVAESETNPCG